VVNEEEIVLDNHWWPVSWHHGEKLVNKPLLLLNLLANIEEVHEDFDPEMGEIGDQLFELQNRRSDAITMLPWSSQAPSQSEAAIEALRKHFRDRVTLISFVLSRLFPDEFFYFRTGDLEDPIFDGFAFFSDVLPELTFDFPRVGRTGFDRYLLLNRALHEVATKLWPEADRPHSRVLALLYDQLALLFTIPTDYNRYWLAAGRMENAIQEQDSKVGEASDWSGKKEMFPGDLVFLYTMSPVKAFTGVYEVTEIPTPDPWGGWDGLWVDLQKLGHIQGLTFAQLKADPVLSQWGPVLRNFQGTVTEPIPHAVYNRLIELIPGVANELCLQPEPLSSVAESGVYSSESDFETKVVEPLLRGWGLQFTQQALCRFQFGVNEHCGRIDFLVRDARGLITIVESKLRILTDDDLARAMAQAKSYALMEGLTSLLLRHPRGFGAIRSIEIARSCFKSLLTRTYRKTMRRCGNFS
jgi:phage tail protein X